MSIAIIGSGYVGLVVAACLAELGHEVTCVDIDDKKIAALNAGETPIHEDYLPELLARYRGRSLTFTTSLADAIENAAIIFIAVGTPTKADCHADLSFVESATREIARSAKRYRVLVEKSTVPVGTGARIQSQMMAHGWRECDFAVVSNPEFLREGTAVSDFLYPDRIVVGADSERAATILRDLYVPLLDGSYARRPGSVPRPDSARAVPEYCPTSQKSAEIIKHASNAFLAMKLSFINAVAGIAEEAGADIEEICKGIGSDARIGPAFLRAGIGYGGPCLAKDVIAFQSVAREYGLKFGLMEETERTNEAQAPRFIAKVHQALGSLRGRRLAVLGLAFKGGTDDVRNSPAIKVIQILRSEGAYITAFDPAAIERAREILGDGVAYASNPYEVLPGADALLILTDWKEFESLDLERVRETLAAPVVIDGRNLFSREQMHCARLNYVSVGREGVKLTSIVDSGLRS
jgi:UDPglucose 6-dehydrogenase